MQGMRLLVGLFSAILLIAFSSSDGDTPAKPTNHLIELQSASLNAFVNVPDVVLVYYYSPQPDVPELAAFQEQVEAAAADLEAYGVKVGAIDVQLPKKRLVRDYGLQGVPHLRVFHGEPKKNPYGGRPLREQFDVFPRSPGASLTSRDIINAVVGRFPTVTRVKEAPSAEASAAVASSGGVTASVAVLVTERARTSPLLRAMAAKTVRSAEFFEVPSTLAAVTKALGVETAPSLVLLPREAFAALVADPEVPPSLPAEDIVRFEGNLRSLSEVVEFVQANAAGNGSTDGTSSGGSEDTAAEDSQTSTSTSSSGVLDAAALEASLEAGSEAWVVAFVKDAATIAEDVPGWSAKASQMGGEIRAAVLECGSDTSSTSTATSTCAHFLGDGAAALPALRVWGYGEGGAKRKPQAFAAAELEAAAATAAESLEPRVIALPGGDALDQSMMQQVLQMMSTDHQGPGPLLICILASRKAEPPLLAKALASAYPDWVKLLFIPQPSAALMQSLSFSRLPSIGVMFQVMIPDEERERLIKAGQSVPAKGETALTMQPYFPELYGPPTFESVDRFLRELQIRAAAAMGASLPGAGSGGNDGFAGGLGGDGAATVPTELLEATDANWPKDFCPASKLCVVLLAERGDDASRALLLEAAASLDGSGASLFGFAWADADCHASFADSLGAAVPPALVVYSPKRQRYARFTGTLTAPNAKEFLEGVLSGRTPTIPALQEPLLSSGVNCEELAEERARDAAAAAEAGAGDAAEEEDLGDLLAEIRAEEELERQRLQKEVEEEMQRQKDAAAAPKKKGKKKKKKGKKAAKDEL